MDKNNILKTNQHPQGVDLFFTTKIHKNCRDFYKRIYDLKVNTNLEFVNSLSIFGKLNINKFSQVIPTAKDVFYVTGDANLEITGAIGNNSILLVIPKNKKQHFILFEKLLEEFVRKNYNPII